MTISDATIERAARAAFAAHESLDSDAYYETLDDPNTLNHYRAIARAALESVGYEEAASIVRELDSIASAPVDNDRFCALILDTTLRARAWSSRYTPEPK